MKKAAPFSLIPIGIAIAVAVFFEMRASKTYTVEIENKSATAIAVIGQTLDFEVIDYGLVEAGERSRVKVGSNTRPSQVMVMFGASVGDGGLPVSPSDGFLVVCSYEDAKAAEPLIASRFEPLGCEEPTPDFSSRPSLQCRAMDKDEEAGLRAFAITVGAYAGASYPERPLWVERDGARIDVTAVEAQWREDERIGFRVRLADGTFALLYYVPELDIWSGALTPGAVHERGQA